MMNPCFILDTSVVLAWLNPDEQKAGVDALFAGMVYDGNAATAPALLPFEVGNGLLMAVKRKRMTADQMRQILRTFSGLPIVLDYDSVRLALSSGVTMAEKHGLTLYDGAYLELASRTGLPLATLDEQLRRAAYAEGVSLMDIG